jgi:lysophospholipase L1-like esterase
LPRIRLLVIWFGANDAVLPHKSQHVPLPIFSSTLSSIIRVVRDPSSPHFSPDTKILLLTPPPFSVRVRKANLDSRKPHPLPMDRDWETTKAYAEAVKAVAEKEEVPVVDCWTAVWHAAAQNEIGLEGFLTDGLHLNEKGYEVVYNGLIGAIKTNFPEMHPDNLQSIFPPYVSSRKKYTDMSNSYL